LKLFRNLFNYYFANLASGNSEIYQKVFLLSNLFEESYKDIENEVEEKVEVQGKPI